MTEVERFTNKRRSDFTKSVGTLSGGGSAIIGQTDTLNAKICFQNEDRIKSQRLREARISTKRSHIDKMGSSIRDTDQVLDNKYQQKL